MAYLHILDSRGDKIPVSAQSAFEGARSGRRLGSWMTSTSGINSLISGTIGTLRSRTRHLRRNNPLIDGGVNSLVSDLIGTGISLSWQLADQELKKILQEFWNDWIEEADFNELCNFYGLQAQVSQGLIESGESLIWMKTQPMSSGLSVPLQLQVLEGDHLDETYSTTLPNGNSIRMGIEFDNRGKRAAYHLWPEHPGESYGFSKSLNRVRIPAKDICHVYRLTRPGQLRGIPWLSSGLVKMYDYDQYEDAELVRKKGAAMIGGYITEPVGNADSILPFGQADSTDSNNREIVPLEPGTFPVLPPGMDVKFSEPADVGANYESFGKRQLRSISRGIGTTYEKFTGDLTEVNYSSIRAGLLDFQRICKQVQLQTLAFQMCRPVAHKFLDMLVLSGKVKIQDYAKNKRRYRRIKWRPDAWPGVDQVKDQLSDQSAVRNGFESRAQVVAKRGGDIEELDAEIQTDNQRADESGFIFDSDPRKTAKSGTSQLLENEAVLKAGGE